MKEKTQRVSKGDSSKNLMVTVSGGRSSAMMARHIQTAKKYKDYNKIYIYANTGQERKETIDFLKNIVKYWKIDLNIIEAVGSNVMGIGINYKVVNFKNLSMNSDPFKAVIRHKNKGTFDGLPNQKSPYCSESLKTIPCKKFCDDIFGVNNYKKAIGFRKEDMPKRITFSECKIDKTRIFPLLTDFYTPVSNLDLNDFWKKEAFKLNIHGNLGNCELCWKKSDKTLVENIRYGTTSVAWWQKMEKKYKNTAYRGRKSIDDLVKLSKEPFTQKIIFEDNDDGCVCSF